MSTIESVKELEEIRQNIAWLREHELFFPEHLARNILLLERITPRLLEIGSRFNDIVEDMTITIAEWDEVLRLTRDIEIILGKMRASYDPIKAQVDIIELIEINASRACAKLSYVKNVSFQHFPTDGVDKTMGTFFTVNEPEMRLLLEDVIKLFNHGDKVARQTGVVEMEVTAKEIATLCRYLEPLLLNPTMLHATEPPILRQIQVAGDRMRRHFRHVICVVKANFLHGELVAAKEGLERMLVKEEFAKQKEIKLKTAFGTKKEYEFLLALASKLCFREE